MRDLKSDAQKIYTAYALSLAEIIKYIFWLGDKKDLFCIHKISKAFIS